MYRINESSDAFSFGKMCLEFICGQISNSTTDSLSDLLEEDDDDHAFPVDESAFEKVVI